jgi:MFS family permease
LLPFVLARIFRPTFLAVFELTNFQLGTLFTTYGIIAFLSYLFGGALADKFTARKLMTTSLLLTAGGGLVLADFPSYSTLQILFGYWGFSTIFLFWAAMIKATRNWGGKKQQGKAFGFLEGGRGIVAASIGTIGVLFFQSYYLKR